MTVRLRATRPQMPGYGLPEGESGLKPWSWAEAIVRDGHNYWLATTRPDGRPHAMPVWGVWHAGAFWLSTGGASRKAKNLALRAECSLGTERAGEAVILEGAAHRRCRARRGGARGSLVVRARVSGEVLGYAIACRLPGGDLHLDEIDVQPAQQRRGIGSALVAAVRARAEALGCMRLTLTTFRFVPWNRPWYERLGFVVLEEHALPPALRAIHEEEIARGLARERRVGMVLELAR